MTTPPLLNPLAFKQYVTGLPLGVVYEVKNPVTGEAYEFHGTSGTWLVTTIADLSADLGPNGLLREGATVHWLGVLAAQLQVAPGQPLLWVCQRESDADALAAAIDDYASVLDTVAADRVVRVTVQPPPDAPTTY